MSALRIIIAVLLTLAGIALLGAGLYTWGWESHVIAMPYREMTGLGATLLGLAGWVWFA